MTDDILLSTIKSRASSTGARRSDQVNITLAGSTEDDEKHPRHHGRRKAAGPSRHGTGGSESDVSVNFLGRMYAKIITYNASLRYLIYIVPVGLVLALPLIVLSAMGLKEEMPVGSQTKTDKDDKEFTVDGPPLFRIFLWVEIAWLTIWAGKLVAFFLPLAFMFFCGVVSSGTRKYATVLRNLTIPFSLFFWALASWITFRNLFKSYGDIDWVRNLGRVLGATFASSAVYLGEKAVVQLIGISYHQRSFANRIIASKKDIHMLATLLDASRAMFPIYCPEFKEEDHIINDNLNIHFPGKSRKGIAAIPQRFVNNIGRVGDRVTTIVGNIASEITGKKILNPNSTHSIVIEALEKTSSSTALGRRIWMSFVIEGKECLFLEDIVEVLGPELKEEAEGAFEAIDENQNGDISLDEMVDKVIGVKRERKAIIEGMKDISQALQAFDKVLLFFILLICIFIFLAFFQSSFITTLATAGTALLSLSFVFAVTTQEFLGSCIFLFVKHPYDVGDRVEIYVDDMKASMLVEQISLLYTVFVRTDKMQEVQMPNVQLNNLWIENVTRSGPTPEIFTIDVSYEHTSFEDVELLRLEMERFTTHPDNAREFQPEVVINVSDIMDLKKITLQFIIMYKINNFDVMARLARKSRFLSAVTDTLRRIPIHPVGKGVIGTAENPNYQVNFEDSDATERRVQSGRERGMSRAANLETVDEQPETAAAAPGGESAPGDDDRFSRADQPTETTRVSTRVSLDVPSGGTPPQRGESHNKGFRKRGETVSTMISRQDTVTAQGSPLLRATTSRRTDDEEAQLHSPLQGGFLTPTPSQHDRSPAASVRARAQQGEDPYENYHAPQMPGQTTMQPLRGSRRGRTGTMGGFGGPTGPSAG